MEQFHSALRSLAEHCQLGHLEDELLRDIFTANMTDLEIQKELLKVTLSPERALKVAIGIELGARNQLTIQSKNTLTPMDKQENVMAISSSRFRGTGRPPRTCTSTMTRQTSHNCRNCGQPWTIDHRSKCQAMGQTCRRCNKPNQFARVCKSNLNRQTNTQRVNEIVNNNVEAVTEDVNNISIDNEVHSQYTNSEDDYSVNMLSPEKDKTTPAKLEIQYGNSRYWVMVDSGSSAGLVTERMAKQIEERDSNTWWSHTTNPVQLRSYTNDPIRNKGTLYSDIQCNGWNAGRADLIVVPNSHRAIIGRDLFQALGITLHQQDPTNVEGKTIYNISAPSTCPLKQEIAIKYKNLTSRIGRSVNHKVKSKFKSYYTPIHQKGRRIPLHLEKEVEEELKKLQTNGHITKLDKCSEEFFISPIVITVKRDKSIKLAMDAKTINKAIHKNKYQMHNIDCLMDSVAQTITQASDDGEVLFSTIDLLYAYSQLPLDKETAKHCNFNIIGGQATGTYRFNTGFYGLTDMPAEFQKAIDITLANLTNTFSFLDDIIIVTKGGIENHKKKLFKCLDKLDEEKLAINIEKCHFAKQKISWLGYEINKNGIKPIVSKTQAILNLQQPKTQKQLKSFLGSIHHLTKFIPNLAETCKDFRKLLQKETKFVWHEQHEAAFNKIKETIRHLTENTHFNITVRLE